MSGFVWGRVLDRFSLDFDGSVMEVEEDYKSLLDSSTQHARAMMGNVLKLCMTPGVVEACRVAAEQE